MKEYIIKYTYQDIIGLAVVRAFNKRQAESIVKSCSKYKEHASQIKVGQIDEMKQSNSPDLLAEMSHKVVREGH